MDAFSKAVNLLAARRLMIPSITFIRSASMLRSVEHDPEALFLNTDK